MRRLFAVSIALLTLAGCSGGGGGKKSSSCPGPVGTDYDADGDLLTDLEEARLGTDPAEADTDNDGFGDYVELQAGTDPLVKADAPSGQVASVREIDNANDLIGGPGAI